MKKYFTSFVIIIIALFLKNISLHSQSNSAFDLYSGEIVKGIFTNNFIQPPEFNLVVLYSQNEIITNPGAGHQNNDVSAVTSPGTLYGFGIQQSIGNRIADDFTIQPGAVWRIDSIKFYAYQTNSGTTSTITSINLKILNGRPDNGSSQTVFGDYTTNRMISTYYSRIYRTSSNPPYQSQMSRPVMCVIANINKILSSGTYWIDAQCSGSLSSGPWAVPRTINNQQTTGNALQKTINGWDEAEDAGYQKGLPFVIYGEIVTGVSNNNTSASQFKLEQNYPNPFNPKTVISFHLAVNSFTTLKVFNASGLEVSTLINQNMKAGSYEIDFDGSKLSSGIYFYSLVSRQGGSSTNDFRQTKKMILVK